MLGRVVPVMINTQNQGDVFIFRGRRNDYFLHGAAKVLLGIVGIRETTGGFDYNLGTDTFPGQGGWIFLFENLDGLAINCNAVGACGNLVRQIAQHRVVLQEMGQSFRIGQVIDCHELQIGVLQRRTQDVPADTSETINAYFYSHVASEREMNRLQQY